MKEKHGPDYLEEAYGRAFSMFSSKPLHTGSLEDIIEYWDNLPNDHYLKESLATIIVSYTMAIQYLHDEKGGPWKEPKEEQ